MSIQQFLLAMALAYLGLALHQHNAGDDGRLQASRGLRELSCAERPCGSRGALQDRSGAGRVEPTGQQHTPCGAGEGPDPLSRGPTA